MTEQTIKGILEVVAVTGGIKIKGNSDWINPTKGAKQDIIDRKKELDKYKGKEVTLLMAGENIFEGIKLNQEKETEQETVSEEPKKKPMMSTEAAKEIIKKVEDENKAKAEKYRESTKSTESTKETKPEECVEEEEESPRVYSKSFHLDRLFDDVIKLVDKDYFKKLQKVKCNTETKNNLLYVTWAEAWEKLKEIYPESNYIVYESESGMPYFYDNTGGFVKVGVTVSNIKHIVYLPIMDYANDPMKTKEYDIPRKDGTKKTVKVFTSFNINTAIQRALTKAIAMHGLGIRIYRGEDFK